ncbi:MAG: transglutaminase family protein [Candidatus Hodarchaeota archaeon]
MKIKISMEDYLKPTEFCDYKNPVISTAVKELTKNDKTPREMALSIFHFVRDQIRFLMVSEDDKASNTLMKKFGDCGTKTNLQVAMLRASNIPARYHNASLHKECLKGIVSKLFYKISPKILEHHLWCECYLSEKWISCDGLLDKPLVEVLLRKGIITKEQIKSTDWDGENNLNTMVNWMIQDKGTFPFLENLMREIKQNSKKYPIKLVGFIINQSNKYTNKIRSQF